MTTGPLIAIDLDGTLIGEDLSIAPEDAAAIERAVGLGAIVCLATGRLFEASKRFADQLGLRAPIIVLQGSAVYDAVNGGPLWCAALPRETARRIYDDLKGEGFHLQLYFGDRLFIDELDDRTRYYLKISPVEPVIVPGLRALLDGSRPPEPGPLKILGIDDRNRVAEHAKVLRVRFAGLANVFRSLPVYLEATDPSASKGNALRWLAKTLGVDQRDTIAIGDSDNDVSMFETAGRSFAVANATAEAKSAADRVVASMRQHGVAEALSLVFAGD